MTDAVARTVVEDFYDAYRSRDPQRIAGFLDDEVDWKVFGPVEVMQVCGHWRGKAAVIDRFARVVPSALDQVVFEIDRMLVDGHQAAIYGRMASRQRSSNRTICHRVAHFVTFRDGKVVQFRCINDSLDAAEQFIGHRIDLTADAGPEDVDLIIL